MIRLSPVVKNIIIINVIFFIATFVFAQSGINLRQTLSGYYILSPSFRPWQLITHMFMHGGIDHIFFNMYALAIFGPALENRLGSKRFLFYYLSCGLGAFFLYMGVNHIEIQYALSEVSPERFEWLMQHLYDEEINATKAEAVIWHGYGNGMLGASGAVFGILMGFGMLFSEVELRLLFPPIAMKAKWFVVIYGAIELLLAIRNAPDDNVAHYAHLGGMLFGYIMIKYWQKKNMIY